MHFPGLSTDERHFCAAAWSYFPLMPLISWSTTTACLLNTYIDTFEVFNLGHTQVELSFVYLEITTTTTTTSHGGSRPCILCCLKVLRPLSFVSFSIPPSIERVIEKEPIWSERRTLTQHRFWSPWMFIVRLSEVFWGHPPHCETGGSK